MAVLVAPEMWFLQGPATDVEASKLRTSAAAFRRMLDAMLSGRQGVVYTRGTCTDLKALATGTPDGFIHVQAGACYVRGTQAAVQGMYHLYNDATFDINVLGANPAHATLDRIDLLVARYQDQFYAGSLDLPTLEMVTGTPAGSPTVPAAPANSLILAQLSIIHATATIPQSVITDRRVPCGNGIIVLDDILVGTDSRYLAATPQIDFLNTSGVGTNLLPPGLSAVELIWYARGDTNASNADVDMRFNNIATATYDWNRVRGTGAAATADENQAQTSIHLGDVPALTATAGYFGTGRATIPWPGSPTGNKTALSQCAYDPNDTAGTEQTMFIAGKWRTVGAPITRLSVLPNAGNYVIGSRFILLGHVGIQP